MATPTKPLLVATPTQTPARFGLLSVAQIVSEPDPHWQNGVEYTANPLVEVVDALNVDCTVDPDDDWPEGLDQVTDPPLRIRTGFTCKHPGLTAEDIHSYASAKLSAAEGPSVEAAVWDQIAATSVATPAGTSAIGIVTAVGDLEAWLWTTYPGVGVLHMPRDVAVAAVAADVVKLRDGRLETALGTPVAAGAYPGTGPAATTSGEAWIGATGAVVLRRSEPRVYTDNAAAYFDYHTNEVFGVAERIYVASFEDVRAVALVDLPD